MSSSPLTRKIKRAAKRDPALAIFSDSEKTSLSTPSGVGIASQAEAEAGTENTKMMTPQRVAQAIAAQAPAGGGPANTDALTEGSTNLYHTPARVRAVVLSGMSASGTALPDDTDSVVSAWSKFLGWASNLAANVRAVGLTGLSTSDSTPITSSDTVIGAMGKLQAQLSRGATREVTGADNFIAADVNTTIRFNSGSAAALTVPDDATLGITTAMRGKCSLIVYIAGTGVPTISAGASTVRGSARSGLAQYSTIVLNHTGEANTWSHA